MTSKQKKMLYGIVGAVVLLTVVLLIFFSSRQPLPMPFHQFISEIKQGRIERLEVRNNIVRLYAKDPEKGKQYIELPAGTDLYTLLAGQGITEFPAIRYKRTTPIPEFLLKMLIVVVFILLTAGIILYYISKTILNKDKAKPAPEDNDASGKSAGPMDLFATITETPWDWLEKPKYSWKDLAGLGGELEKEINEITEMYISPQRFTTLGARLPNGVLFVGPSGTGKTMAVHSIAGALKELKAELRLVRDILRSPQEYREANCRLPTGMLLLGPPGVGKTLLAKGLAHEAGIPFLFTSGSQFTEMYVGVGAARMRSLFRLARAQQPCIIFIDEIETIAYSRATNSSGAQESNNTLSQLLSEIDGFSRTEGIFVIGATNIPQGMLDPALLRPGRMEMVMQIPVPDFDERKEILEIYLDKGTSELSAQEIENFSGQIEGETGAFIENVVNTARLLSVKEGKKGALTYQDLIAAHDKITKHHTRLNYN